MFRIRDGRGYISFRSGLTEHLCRRFITSLAIMLTCGQIPDIVVGIAPDQTVSNRAFDYSGGVEKTLSAPRTERQYAQPEHRTFHIQPPFLADRKPID